jgi:hypothetical protein
MFEHFYAYLIQPTIDDLIKDKIFRLIKILLFKIKKIPSKNKLRLRLLETNGGINGLLSKMLSNTAFFQTQSTTNKLISETFLLNLIEIFLDFSLDGPSNTSKSAPSSPTFASQIINFDSLWTIFSLLTPSVLCLNNYWQHKIVVVLSIRLKLCKLLIKYINLNVNSVQFLVKSYGWQDILCQYLCYSHKPIHETQKIASVPTVETKKQQPKPEVITSTPTVRSNTMRKIFKNDFRKYSSYSTSSTTSVQDDRLESFDENDEIMFNNEAAEYENRETVVKVSKGYRNTIENDVDISASKEKIKEIEQVDNGSNYNTMNDSTTDTDSNSREVDAIKMKLCDKVVNLLFKFAWNGLSGSSELSWKVWFFFWFKGL